MVFIRMFSHHFNLHYPILITIKSNANKQGFLVGKLHKYSDQLFPKSTIRILDDLYPST